MPLCVLDLCAIEFFCAQTSIKNVKITDRTLIRISSIIRGITANVVLFVELFLILCLFVRALRCESFAIDHMDGKVQGYYEVAFLISVIKKLDIFD